jgi:GT2 family glycosyltransferase
VSLPGAVRDGPSLVSVVIPTYNRVDSLRRCLHSVFRTTPSPDEVIVIDDASQDSTELMIREEFPQVAYVRHQRRELPAKAVNDGILIAKGPYVLIVDDDNVVDPRIVGAIREAFQQDSRIAVVGAVSYYLSRPDTVMYAAVRLRRFSRRIEFIGRGGTASDQPYGLCDIELCHNCVAIRREAALRAGLVDSSLLPHFNYEIALQSRLRAEGYRIVLNPEAKVWHDVPLDPRNTRTLESPIRLYYTIRSKIVFEKYFDTALGRFAYSQFLPMYLLGYLIQIVSSGQTRQVRLASVRLALGAFHDGLIGRYGIKIL